MALIMLISIILKKAKSRPVYDLRRVVIPKEIRRTMRIREGDPSHNTLTLFDKFCIAIHSVVNRYKETAR
jgi:bifunctional DNA-binding transcriptional regulator/antitoxin component of YhaV-PrlF toxin-antitoxin module